MNDLLQRAAGHVLHHDEEHVLLFLRGEDGHDVRMVHRREKTRLLQHLREVEVLFMRDLDRDLLVNPGVLSEENAAEATAAERRKDSVLADRLTLQEHGRIIAA
jgi:hypothetical protein